MIEVKNLTKKYGSGVAVSDLSFTVEPGRIYGFLGPNGAGKSTTMNIITGCLAPTEGQVLINGYDILEEPEEAKKFIGYLPELPPVYPDNTPLEYLDFVGRAKGLRGVELKSQIDYVLSATALDAMKSRLIKNLSKGYKQRVGIAQAMLGNPEVIILDEPTVGLDPRQIISIRNLIKKLGEKHTVILSSHILSEISAVCDYVMIISHGKLVASDSLDNLSNSLKNGRMIDMTVRTGEQEIENALGGIDGITEYEISETDEDGVLDIRITADPEKDIRDGLFKTFASLGAPVYKLAPEVMTLEDMFLRLTNDAPELPPEEESGIPEEEYGVQDEDGYYDDGYCAATGDETDSNDDNYTEESEGTTPKAGEKDEKEKKKEPGNDGDGYTSLFS